MHLTTKKKGQVKKSPIWPWKKKNIFHQLNDSLEPKSFTLFLKIPRTKKITVATSDFILKKGRVKI